MALISSPSSYKHHKQQHLYMFFQDLWEFTSIPLDPKPQGFTSQTVMLHIQPAKGYSPWLFNPDCVQSLLFMDSPHSFVLLLFKPDLTCESLIYKVLLILALRFFCALFFLLTIKNPVHEFIQKHFPSCLIVPKAVLGMGDTHAD